LLVGRVDQARESVTDFVRLGEHLADLVRPSRAGVEPGASRLDDRPRDRTDVGRVEIRVLVGRGKVGARGERLARLRTRRARFGQRADRRCAGGRTEELPACELHEEILRQPYPPSQGYGRSAVALAEAERAALPAISVRHWVHVTIPRSGRAGSGSIARNSSRWPSGSVK